MSEKFFITCACGHRVSVELFEAGTSKVCTNCQSELRVPDTTTLRELNGDRYPLLSPVQKILKTLENSEPPFDGLCHACESQQATFSTPFRVSIMVERIVEEGGEIRPSIAGGIALKKGKSEETWEQLRFPLLLCENCQRSFERSRKWWQMKTKLKSLSMVILLLGFLVLSYFNMEAVAVLTGVFAVIGIIAFAMQHRVNSQVDTFIQRWIYNIRWVPETLGTEEEFTVKVGESSPFEPVISIK